MNGDSLTIPIQEGEPDGSWSKKANYNYTQVAGTPSAKRKDGLSVSGNADFGNGYGLGIENGKSGVSSSLTILGSQQGSVDRYGNYTPNENFLGEINGQDVADLIKSQLERNEAADAENPDDEKKKPEGLVDLAFMAGAFLMTAGAALVAGGGSSAPSGGTSAGNGGNVQPVTTGNGKKNEDDVVEGGSGEGGAGGGQEGVSSPAGSLGQGGNGSEGNGGMPVKSDREAGNGDNTPSKAAQATRQAVKDADYSKNIKLKGDIGTIRFHLQQLTDERISINVTKDNGLEIVENKNAKVDEKYQRNAGNKLLLLLKEELAKGKKVTIDYGSTGRKEQAFADITGNSAEIRINNKVGQVVMVADKELGTVPAKSPGHITLGHEIIHVLNEFRGNTFKDDESYRISTPSEGGKSDFTQIDPKEALAIGNRLYREIENRIVLVKIKNPLGITENMLRQDSQPPSGGILPERIGHAGFAGSIIIKDQEVWENEM